MQVSRKRKSKNIPNDYNCEYCKRSFKHESSLIRHMCEPKRRFMQKDEKYVRLGFKFYNDWYARSMGTKKSKTYEQFASSNYYIAFIKFGKYILETKVNSPDQYLKYLIDNQIKLDKWPTDSNYKLFLTNDAKKETAPRALERFILHAESWAESNNCHWSDYWRNAGLNLILHDIRSGKISPWILLSYQPANQTLANMPNEILTEIADILDLEYWNRKITVNKPMVKWIQEVLE